MRSIRIAAVRYPITALGPGRRLGIWLQGCTLGCAGCMARDTWDPHGGTATTVDQVVAEALALVDGPVDGVTISGGEPFQQAEALAELAGELRGALATESQEIDILCYSGYRWQTLVDTHAEVLEALDAVMSEPFASGAPTDLPWRGSANQQLHLLTPLGHMRFDAAGPVDRSLQIRIDDERIEVVGIPARGQLAALEEQLAAAGIELREATWRP